MLHRRQRTVLHYDVRVVAQPAGAPAQSMLTVVRQLKAAADKGDAVHIRNKGQSVLRISRVKIDNAGSRAVLLLQHTNKDTADPSFSHLETGKIRTEPKMTGEGVAVSAHVFADLTPSSATPATFHVLLEAVPGLTRSYVDDLLAGVLRRYGEYSFKDINGAARSARPSLDFQPRLSECFLQDVAKGRLSNIVLVKYENASDLFDADPTIRVREATLKVVPVEKANGSPAVNFVQRVIKAGRDEGYTSAKFSYADETGKQKTPTFGIDKADTFEAFVAKASAFEVEQDLCQCEAEIRVDVAQKMHALLKKHLAGLAA